MRNANVNFDKSRKKKTLSLFGCGECHGDLETQLIKCAASCSEEGPQLLKIADAGCLFSRIVDARDDMDTLGQVLSSYAEKDQLEVLEKSEHLTNAEMHVSACVRGEWSYESEPYRMLGLYGSDVKGYTSIEDGIARLRRAGMKHYTDDSLKELLLYEDAESGQQFKDVGKKKKIDYELDDYSKEITCEMKSDGKISLEIAYERTCDYIVDEDEEW